MKHSLTFPNPQQENTVTIFVTEAIQDNYCIMCESGIKLYKMIAVALIEGKKVILSFYNAEDITSAFLAETFTKLYTNFSTEKIETSLSITDLSEDEMLDLDFIIQDVKDYLRDPQHFMSAIIEVLGEDCL
jgi:STAS-like domain of unknown function (DUF4325)